MTHKSLRAKALAALECDSADDWCAIGKKDLSELLSCLERLESELALMVAVLEKEETCHCGFVTTCERCKLLAKIKE